MMLLVFVGLFLTQLSVAYAEKEWHKIGYVEITTADISGDLTKDYVTKIFHINRDMPWRVFWTLPGHRKDEFNCHVRWRQWVRGEEKNRSCGLHFPIGGSVGLAVSPCIITMTTRTVPTTITVMGYYDEDDM